MILHHLGRDLDKPLAELTWAKNAQITSGYDYLLTLLAFLIREPKTPWPYVSGRLKETSARRFKGDQLD